MSKEGEIRYLARAEEDDRGFYKNKPFSLRTCAGSLMEIGAVMSLLGQPSGKLLDLGCGAGWTSNFFARRGFDVTGVDICADKIQCADEVRQRDSVQNLRFVAGDFEGMGYDGEFDRVVFFDSLHHAVDEEAAIRMACKALKPGGICVTSEPGRWHARTRESVEATRERDVTERDMPPWRILRAARKAGFRRFRVYPHANHVHALLYGDADARFLEGRLKPGAFRTCLAWLLRRVVVRSIALFILVLLCRRLSAIVVLEK